MRYSASSAGAEESRSACANGLRLTRNDTTRGEMTRGTRVMLITGGSQLRGLGQRRPGGTSTALVFTIAAKVAFNPSTISWTSTTPLPVGLSGHAVAAATLPGATPTSVVYVVGGADSTNAPRNSVLYATVSSTGAVGTWTTTTVLPASLAFAAAVVATPANSPVTGNSYL